MSKFVKNLITEELSSKLQGVNEMLLVNVIGLNSSSTYTLRKQLREKKINLVVVKNSLARRACEGTPLAAAFDGVEGTLAIVWGSEDIVSLAKEVTKLDEDKKLLEKFEARGGVLDGEHLSPEMVKSISKWPSRAEQLSLLVGQILSPGRSLCSQLIGPGGKLASQIEKKSKEEEGSGAAESPAA